MGQMNLNCMRRLKVDEYCQHEITQISTSNLPLSDLDLCMLGDLVDHRVAFPVGIFDAYQIHSSKLHLKCCCL